MSDYASAQPCCAPIEFLLDACPADERRQRMICPISRDLNAHERSEITKLVLSPRYSGPPVPALHRDATKKTDDPGSQPGP